MAYNFNDDDSLIESEDYLQEYFDDISDHIKKNHQADEKVSTDDTEEHTKKKERNKKEKNKSKNNLTQKAQKITSDEKKMLKRKLKEHHTKDDIKELIFNIDKYIAPILINIILFVLMLLEYYTFSLSMLLLSLVTFLGIVLVPAFSVYIIDANPATETQFKKVSTRALSSFFAKTDWGFKLKFIVRSLIGYCALAVIFILWLIVDIPIINILKWPIIFVAYILLSYILNSATIVAYSSLINKKYILDFMLKNIIFYLIPGAIFVLPTLNGITYKNIS